VHVACGYSRRRFSVNMGFTDDDRILIENLYILKVRPTVQKKLIKEFPDKGWALSSLNKLVNYLNILPVCFASFFLTSRDVIAFKNFTVSDIMISVHMLYHYNERNTSVCCKFSQVHSHHIPLKSVKI